MLTSIMAVAGGLIGCVFVVLVEKEMEFKKNKETLKAKKIEPYRDLTGILSVGLLFIGFMASV